MSLVQRLSENKLGIDEYSEISDVLCSDGLKDFDSGFFAQLFVYFSKKLHKRDF